MQFDAVSRARLPQGSPISCDVDKLWTGRLADGSPVLGVALFLIQWLWSFLW